MGYNPLVKNPEVFYAAEYLGVIGEEQYKVFRHFFTSGGLERVNQRLPFVVGRTVDKAALRELDRLIRHSISSNEFVADRRTTAPLRNRKQDIEFWNRFQGSVTEILCEDSIRLHAEGDEILISDQELHQAFRRLHRTHPMVEALGRHFNVRFGENTYACPDGLGVNSGVNNVVIQEIYEYKSTPVGEEHSIGQPSKIRRLLKNDPMFRKLLRIGVADIQGVDPSMVRIPLESIRIILVSAQESIFKGINLERYYNDHLTLGLPNVRAAAYFILKCMLGDIRECPDWRDYFQVVSPGVVGTIGVIRGISTNPGMRGRR